jgi:hypothetical protein
MRLVVVNGDVTIKHWTALEALMPKIVYLMPSLSVLIKLIFKGFK